MGGKGNSIRTKGDSLDEHIMQEARKGYYQKHECKDRGTVYIVYKAVNEGMASQQDHEPYELDKLYQVSGDVKLCNNGYHASFSPQQTSSYYRNFDSIYIVELWGDVDLSGDKLCGRYIKFLEIFSGMPSTEDGNTGYCNTGCHNVGDCNTGYYNAGYHNVGDYNTGDWNTGYCNTGYHNTGCGNTGSYNAGEYNVGDYNVGDHNVGDHNVGDFNTGDFNFCDLSNGLANTYTGPVRCFDGALVCDWGDIPGVCVNLAQYPEDDDLYAKVLKIPGVKPRKLAKWRKRYIALMRERETNDSR